MLISSNTTQSIVLFPEIIWEIISYLHDDKKTLLTLGLVSKQTLYESRCILFSTVDFYGRSDTIGWDNFRRFLRLIDVAWTSFTPAIQCISLKNAYTRPRVLPNRPPPLVVELPQSRFNYDAGSDITLARIRTNLHNVKSLGFSRLVWDKVPSDILDLVLQLPIEHLSLSWCDTPNLPSIFSRLAPSLTTLDITRIKFAMTPDLLPYPSIFRRPFRFETLDSQSLLVFKNVWDPSIYHDLDFKVKTLSIQPVQDWPQWHQWDGPFISRFLQRVGPSIENLTFPLTDYSSEYEPDPGISSLLDLIHVSQYSNLRSLNIGTIILEDRARNSAVMIDIVQKFLSALPSPRLLQEITMHIKPDGPSLEQDLTTLEIFEWSSLVETIQRLFPSLNKLVIWIIASHRQDPDPYLDLLRRVANVKKLEKEDFIQLHLIPPPPRIVCRYPVLRRR